ncbi:MAG: hypothetical protein Q8O31_03210 [Rhodocyclaceae bacterium]|nr:hypothetical protein [Rhodocyclaceae bacterium]
MLKKSIVFVTLLSSLSASADQPLTTDDTVTQGAGGHQFEFAQTHTHEDDGAGALTKTTTDPLIYTYGVTDALDVYLAASHARKNDGIQRTTGHGNPVVGFKWRFHETDKSWSWGMKSEIQMGSATAETNGLGNGKDTHALVLITSRETSFGEFHVNLSRTHVHTIEGNTNRKHLTRLSAAPVWQVNEQFKLALDLGIQTNPDSTQSQAMGYGLLGLVYSHDDNLEFVCGAKRQFHDGPLKAKEITAGVTWRFK